MLILISGNYEKFVETALVFKNVFECLGFNNVEIKFAKTRDQINCKKKNVFIIYGKYLNLNIINYCKKYVYFVEQPDQLKRYKPFLRKSDHVFFMFKKSFNQWEFTEKSFLPFGYHSLLDRQNQFNFKPINYYFFGSMSKERQKLWNENFIYKEFCYGQERDDLINNSKINLIIGARKNYHLPHIHFSLILSKGGFVALNNINNFIPFELNKHFIIYNDYNELQSFLMDYEFRREFSKKAYEDFKINFNMIDLMREEWKKINS